MEEDDNGIPPEPLRQFFIRTDGLWQLTLDDPAFRLKAVRQLRSILTLSLADAASMLKTGVLWQGTRSEVNWLLDTLQFPNKGIISVRLERPGSRGGS